jgi:hypothetical protein
VQRFRLAVAVVFGVLGSLWLGQGLGLIPGSFMTGDQFWAVAGIAAIGLGVFVAWDALRRP